MYAATHIVSHVTRQLYAPMGTEIEVINSRGEVAICLYNGQRFPCHVSKLIAEKPDFITEYKQEKNEQSTKRRSSMAQNRKNKKR
jgi:hypothetical protein